MTKQKPNFLNACDYEWNDWNRPSKDGAFGFLKQEKLPVAVRDVFFDEDTFKETNYERNYVHLDYYGTGRVNEYAAVLCEDGSILFCIVYGKVFAGTFASSDGIEMRYYKLTKI